MTHNDITGNALITKPSTDAYRSGWDAIFGKVDTPSEPIPDSSSETINTTRDSQKTD